MWRLSQDFLVFIIAELNAPPGGGAGGASASTSNMNLSSVLDNAVSSAVDMLTSIQRMDPSERLHSRSVSLRDMMRRATAAAARGLEDSPHSGESSSLAIPTLTWPPDPASPFDATARPGKRGLSIQLKII